MRAFRLLGACVALCVLIGGCGHREIASDTPLAPTATTTARPRRSRPIDAATVEVLAGTGAYNQPLMDLMATSDDIVLRLTPKSNPRAFAEFIEAFRNSHGFWQDVTLTVGNPDEDHEEYNALVSLDKEVYSDDEPIMLTLGIVATEAARWWEAGWTFYSPEHIRIRDEQGDDVNLFCFPVSTMDCVNRWGATPPRTFDLTSFCEPRHGIECVNRFAPGTYTATFHFSFGYPHRANSLGTYDFAHPRVWGPRHSNTVSFTVREGPHKKRADVKELFARAAALTKKNLPNDAVETLKKIVKASRDQAVIEKAIDEIMLIRVCAMWDYVDGFEPLERLAEMVEKHRVEKADWRRRNNMARELSLLHLPENERKKWCDRYQRLGAEEFVDDAEKDALTEFFFGCGPHELFHYPQFRSIMVEQLTRPAECASFYVEAYLGLPIPKDPATMKVLAARSVSRNPYRIFDYYGEHKAPIELIPFLAARGLADKLTKVDGYALGAVEDSALAAFEKAVGLDLGYDEWRSWKSGSKARARDRAHIRALLAGWWRQHSHDYGVTDGADEATVAARIAAIKDADYVLEGLIKSAKKSEGGVSVALTKRRAIKGVLNNYQPEFRVPAGVAIPKTLLAEGIRVVVCLTRDKVDPAGRPAGLVLKSPAALWKIDAP